LKRLTRSPRAQGALARVTSAYLRWTLSTIRWRWVGRETVEQVWAQDSGVVVCFWHSRLLMAPAIWPVGSGQTAKILVSLSADGEFIARAMDQLGYPRSGALPRRRPIRPRPRAALRPSATC
jgi:lysophospholipid acyltransferase (LPLAT)-like uncharacterized protein